MALQDNVNGQAILGSKANEHGSAIGRTPPTILHFAPGAEAGDDVAKAMAMKQAIVPLQVAGVFSGISCRLSEALAGEATYVEAGSNNDWPEANSNRTAKALLADETGKVTTTLSIPYIADAVTDVGVRTALLALLAAHDYRAHALAGAPRLTRVLRVQIVSK